MSSKSFNCPSPHTKDNVDISMDSHVNHVNLNQLKNPYDLNLQTDAPIGLFDSGVGGLSVFLHLAKLMPNEKYLYYADTKNVPYGSRCKEEIQQLTLTAVAWLVNAGCKIVVIACNSASAYALELARKEYPQIPIVGLVPALKPAVLASESKHVAVLATQATLAGDLLNRVIQEVAIVNNVQVTKWYDPALVPWVEAGMPEDSPTANSLRAMLAEFAQQNVDHIVLGCTHYPFFRDFLLTHIQEKNYSMRVVDSGRAIALRVYDLLHKAKKLQLLNQHQDTTLNKMQNHTLVLNLDKLYLQQSKLESVVQGTIDTALDIWQIRTNMTQLAFYATKRDAKLLNLIIKLAT